MIHKYYIRKPGYQSWIEVSQRDYHNLKRRKGSKEKVVDGFVSHYLDIPFSWTDKFEKL